MKAYSGYVAQQRIQHCREIMGGHGYSRFNMIGAIRNHNDMNITWDGENTVLIQQAQKFILDHYKSKMKGNNVSEHYKVRNI
jgi:acyl-CoA oxidase